MKTKNSRLVALFLCIVVIFTASLTGCTKKTEKEPITTTEIITEATEIQSTEEEITVLIPLESIKDTELVKISDYAPDIMIDLRYATENNFTGKVIYEFKEPYIRCGTMKKLLVIQEELAEQGLGLCIWDAYRPVYAQEAVYNATPDDKKGTYVASPEGGNHSRGHTVDGTLYDLETGELLEMPSEFDDFSEKAHPDLLDDDTDVARKNVKILIELMTKDKRFSTIKSEWWHFVDTDSYELHDFDPAKLEKAEAKRDEAISKISQELEDAMVLERDTYPAE